VARDRHHHDGVDAHIRSAAGRPLLHVCAAAHASDMTLLGPVLLAQRLARAEDTVTGASLDHAMWFHARSCRRLPAPRAGGARIV
jgi:acyl-CoA thioesterase